MSGPNLMDIAPVYGSVKTSKFAEPVVVPGISLNGLVLLIKAHPELLPLMKGEAGDISLTKMMGISETLTQSILAAGLGYDPSDEAVRERVKIFTPDDVLDIGAEIMKQSFPGGLESFLERLLDALAVVNKGVEKGKLLKDSLSPSPVQPNS